MAHNNPFAPTALEEEDAAKLQLGPDFSDATSLMNDDVMHILKAKEEQTPTPVLVKTRDYVQRFGHFKNRETATSARGVLESYNLAHFELGSIGNLCPEELDEAKALVPSLENTLDDEQIESMLNELAAYKKFE